MCLAEVGPHRQRRTQTQTLTASRSTTTLSPSVLWVLEGFGFSPIGQGLEWIQGGRIGLGGELPVNTSGGMLSESYLQGWNNHASMIEQLRGLRGRGRSGTVAPCCMGACRLFPEATCSSGTNLRTETKCWPHGSRGPLSRSRG